MCAKCRVRKNFVFQSIFRILSWEKIVRGNLFFILFCVFLSFFKELNSRQRKIINYIKV